MTMFHGTNQLALGGTLLLGGHNGHTPPSQPAASPAPPPPLRMRTCHWFYPSSCHPLPITHSVVPFAVGPIADALLPPPAAFAYNIIVDHRLRCLQYHHVIGVLQLLRHPPLLLIYTCPKLSSTTHFCPIRMTSLPS